MGLWLVTMRLAAATLAIALLTGCSAGGGPHRTGHHPERPPIGPGYWTAHRLLDARPWRVFRGPLPSPGATPTPRQGVKTLRVGALFDTDSSGDHFCTASVVASPVGNVLVTAAHCVNSGTGGANRSDIVFIPNYADGQTPDGVWTPSRYVLDPRWVKGADPDLDVAFIVLKPLNGKNIQQVLGGDPISFDAGFRHLVRVIGYPSSASAPIGCLNWTSQQSGHQLKFVCADFTGGTSGSPWIIPSDRRDRTGTIIGVIGGYQQGGNTAEVSYSAYLDDDIKKLYEQAVSSGG
jgi:V8-like Glu-specific endopeptidase